MGRRAGGALLTAAAVLMGIVVAAPASAAPVVWVTPANGALEGQPLLIAVTDKGTGVEAVLCGGTQASTCAIGGDAADGASTLLAPDGRGGGTGRLKARRSLVVGSTTYDCTTGCHVAVVDAGNLVLASTPVTIAASGTYTWPQAQLTATVVDPYDPDRRWQLDASGLSPWADLGQGWPGASIDVCRDVPNPTAADCRTGELPYVPLIPWLVEVEKVAPDGTAEGAWPLQHAAGPPGGPFADCRVVACTVALSQDGNPVTNRVPITFPDEWLPWPTVDRFLTEGVERAQGSPLTAEARAQMAEDLAAHALEGPAALAAAASAAPSTTPAAEVYRIYSAFFRRSPETDGLAYWIGRVEAGLSVSAMGRLFGGTAEFRSIYDGLTDRQVVERTYSRTLGRAPGEAEIAYWVGRLEGGLARSTLIVHFSRSLEFKTREATYATNTVLSWTFLRRAVAPGDIGLPAASVASRILGSDELYDQIHGGTP
jgi:hypothetical protein